MLLFLRLFLESFLHPTSEEVKLSASCGGAKVTQLNSHGSACWRSSMLQFSWGQTQGHCTCCDDDRPMISAERLHLKTGDVRVQL